MSCFISLFISLSLSLSLSLSRSLALLLSLLFLSLSPPAFLPGIDLENIVYYKDDTHYFVMTAKKKSLLKKGVIKQVRPATQHMHHPGKTGLLSQHIFPPGSTGGDGY